MKPGTLRKVLKEDLARFGQLPSWIDPFLNTFNQLLDQFTSAMRGKLTVRDNLSGKMIEIKFTSGVEKVVAMPENSRVVGIQVLEVLEKIVTGSGFSRKGDGSIGITVTWTGGGDALCRIMVHTE